MTFKSINYGFVYNNSAGNLGLELLDKKVSSAGSSNANGKDSRENDREASAYWGTISVSFYEGTTSSEI